MNKIALTIIALLLVCGSLVYALNKGDNKVENKKILIAYFSWGGNTKSIAEKIHSQIGGDMFQIEPITPYPANYNETAYGIAKEQHEKNIHPPIKNTDISGYDVIYLGTPAWWYTMAPPVATFLDENNFKGKTIIPFITHGGGGKYTIAQDIQKLAPDAKVKLSPFVVYEKEDSNTDKELKKWLDEVK